MFELNSISNLPNNFPSRLLQEFNFGLPEAKNDPLLDACALKIAPIAQFLDEDKSILIGDRGTGKTAVFRLVSEGKLSFNTSKGDRQIIIPIDEDLSYKTLKGHIEAHIKDPAKDTSISHRLVWELFILSRTLDVLSKSFGDNVDFKKLYNKFYDSIEWKNSRKPSLIEIFTVCKKTIGVKLENGYMGYVVPNFYTSLEPSKGEESASEISFLDVPDIKDGLCDFLGNQKVDALILIDKLDEFVSGEEYATQLLTLQALLHCWRGYQSFRQLSLKLFLRKDLYDRLDFSAIGKDKLDSYKVELTWTDEDIRHLIGYRIFYNMDRHFTKRRSLSLKINDKTMAVDKNILNELRSIDSIPASEMSIIKHAQRFLLQFLALLRLRSRDSYDANTVNRNDLIHTALITSFFPRSANHKTKNKRVEAIEITKYFSGHFKFSGGSTTPRTILLFLQQALVVARRYYEQNQNPTIKINEKGEYPVFLRDHLSDAYEDIRKLSYQTVAGLSQKWKRAAGAVMLYAAQSKTPDYISFKDGKRVILKIMPNEDLVDIVNFFAFYEHTGLLQCTNRSTDVTERRYYISIIFQCLEADYINI